MTPIEPKPSPEPQPGSSDPLTDLTDLTEKAENLPLEQARLRLAAGSTNLGQHLMTKRERQAIYLAAFANTHNVRASALKAGVNREHVYRWRQNRAFCALEAKAELDYLDALRAQIDVRSRDSDAILMFRAKSLLPEYKETLRQEHVIGGTDLPVRFTLNIGESKDDAAPSPEAPPLTGTNGHPTP